jgi:hypothetical protein
MADYFPLIARAVGGLEKSTGEARRALYERARSALVAQLRSVEPALEEAEITRERLALEESIRKVEAEAVMHEQEAKEKPEAPAPAEAPSKPATPSKPPPSSPPSETAEVSPEERAKLREQALRNFRETMAEADGLGEAVAETNRAAREKYQRVPHERPLPKARPNRVSGEKTVEGAGAKPLSKEPSKDLPDDDKPPSLGPVPPYEPTGAGWPPPPAAAFDAEADRYAHPSRNFGRIVAVAAVLLLVIAVAGVGYWQRGAISSMFARHEGSQPAPQQQAQQPTVQPKITDRVGPSSDTPSNAANAPAAQVAQKVVLYDEDPNDPQGKRYVGSAIWRTETVSPGPGLAPELAIRCDVEIPERRMHMTWSLRRNTDKALPASHTVEIMFTLPSDFAEGGVGNVPGVLMKQNEQARGVPLAGLAVKVTNGYFLIGLSAVDVDMQRNIQLLKERDWFDIPIVYTSGKRAILAVEKGTPGARAFEEAFRAWGE